MKVTIRREEYEVYFPEHVRVDDRGVCPHLLLFSGEHWQRVAMNKTDAERAASAVRAALRQGHKHLDLNRKDIGAKLPRMVRCASDWDS